MPIPAFELLLPNPYKGNAPIKADVRGVAWTRLELCYRDARSIKAPGWLFDADHRVADETAYVIAGGCELLCAPSGIEPDSVIVLLESPHRSEFKGPGGPALGPLRDPTTRKRFVKHAPDLLLQASTVSGLDLTEKRLVLANAIQYQTSLQALKSNFKSKIDTKIRDVVWTELFMAGGADDLVERLASYRPALVLVASTNFTVSRLAACLTNDRQAWPTLIVDEHPSRWWRNRPKILRQL